MVEDLLRSYQKPLGDKDVLSEQDLVKIIKIDCEKIYFALTELSKKNIAQILQEFFGKESEHIPDILAYSKKKELCHIGFEIYEPLDMVLEGFRHAFDRLNGSVGIQFAIRKVLRFPASESFQNRVNAYTEIMRIWVELNGREFMLELFDIHRPVEIFSVERKHRINKLLADTILRAGEENHIDSNSRRNVFSRDNIWHYAIDVRSSEDVLQLHEYLKKFVVDRNTYILPFENIVHNPNDGSFYSKIINKDLGIELEFVTTVQ